MDKRLSDRTGARHAALAQARDLVIDARNAAGDIVNSRDWIVSL